MDPPQLTPAHAVANGWNMVGFKSTATNVTTTDHLDAMEYVRMYGYENGEWFLVPGPPYDNPKMKPGLGCRVAFTEPGIVYP